MTLALDLIITLVTECHLIGHYIFIVSVNHAIKCLKRFCIGTIDCLKHIRGVDTIDCLNRFGVDTIDCLKLIRGVDAIDCLKPIRGVESNLSNQDRDSNLAWKLRILLLQ